MNKNESNAYIFRITVRLVYSILFYLEKRLQENRQRQLSGKPTRKICMLADYLPNLVNRINYITIYRSFFIASPKYQASLRGCFFYASAGRVVTVAGRVNRSSGEVGELSPFYDTPSRPNPNRFSETGVSSLYARL